MLHQVAEQWTLWPTGKKTAKATAVSTVDMCAESAAKLFLAKHQSGALFATKGFSRQ
jgi:hypothetical protein